MKKIKLSKNMKLKDFIGFWQENVAVYKYSPVTIIKNNSIINKRIIVELGDIKMHQLSVLKIKYFLNNQCISSTLFKYQKNHNIMYGTFKRIKAVLSTIMQSACEYEIIDFNPCKRINLEYKNQNLKTDNRIHFYDKKTYLKVINLLKKEPIEKRLVIEFALKTGLRKGELFGLTWKDINLDNKTVNVCKSRQFLKEKGMFIKDTKNKSSIRTIIIGNSLINLLKKYKEYSLTSDDSFVFENLNFCGISEWFKRWQIKNHIAPIRFHDLRHTHATLLLSVGVDIKTISQRLRPF